MTVIYEEQLVLGSVIKKGLLFEQMELESKHFSDKAHKYIYESMKELYTKGEPISIETLPAELGGRLEQVGNISYLVELEGSVASTESFDFNEKNVFKNYRRREDHALIKEFNKNRTDENRAKLIMDLERLQSVGVKDERKSTRENYVEIAEEIIEGISVLDGGYKTGLTDFDEMTGGLQRGKFIVIGGRPSMAKTALTVNMAMKISEDGGTPHFMTYEMSTQDLLKRIISTKGNVDGDVWLDNDFKEEDYHKAITAIGVLSEETFEIYEYIYKVRKMKAIMRKAIEEEPEKKHILIVDGVNFLHAEQKGVNKTQQIEEVAQDLQEIARELDIPVILVSQLNRGVEQREDKRPVMSDLKDSGSLEQLSDLVVLLYRDEYYYEDTDQKGIAELIIGKHRQGRKGTINLSFSEKHGKFTDLQY